MGNALDDKWRERPPSLWNAERHDEAGPASHDFVLGQRWRDESGRSRSGLHWEGKAVETPESGGYFKGPNFAVDANGGREGFNFGFGASPFEIGIRSDPARDFSKDRDDDYSICSSYSPGPSAGFTFDVTDKDGDGVPEYGGSLQLGDMAGCYRTEAPVRNLIEYLAFPSLFWPAKMLGKGPGIAEDKAAHIMRRTFPSEALGSYARLPGLPQTEAQKAAAEQAEQATAAKRTQAQRDDEWVNGTCVKVDKFGGDCVRTLPTRDLNAHTVGPGGGEKLKTVDGGHPLQKLGDPLIDYFMGLY